jgi:hypothetical protein
VGRQFANEEFLKEVRDSRRANADKRIFESQPNSITAARRIVEVGDAAGGKASQDA